MAGGEREAIERVAALVGPLVPPEVGIGDDAAVVATPASGLLLIAADLVVAGVHADLTFCSFADVGWKAVAVNVSDIAAMGGRPLHALVSVVVAPGTDLDELYEGLVAASSRYGCTIAGGDLSGGPDLVVAVTVTGAMPQGPDPPEASPVLRSGARAGDTIFVTGPLGSSSAGLALLRSDPDAGGPLAAAHKRPSALVEEGVTAGRCGATAMIDVSDGLATDLGHVADASQVGFALDSVPVADGATLADALGGGEDYELVFTAPDGAAVLAGFAGAGLRAPLVIGRCLEDRASRLLAGEPVPSTGFEHHLG
jgi:thiamine-monophosphate kinase